MSEIVRYRTRWMDGAGFAVVERLHQTRAFGFWPVHNWIAVAHFPTPAAAAQWIIERHQDHRAAVHNPDKAKGEGDE